MNYTSCSANLSLYASNLSAIGADGKIPVALNRNRMELYVLIGFRLCCLTVHGESFLYFNVKDFKILICLLLSRFLNGRKFEVLTGTSDASEALVCMHLVISDDLPQT